MSFFKIYLKKIIFEKWIRSNKFKTIFIHKNCQIKPKKKKKEKVLPGYCFSQDSKNVYLSKDDD